MDNKTKLTKCMKPLTISIVCTWVKKPMRSCGRRDNYKII